MIHYTVRSINEALGRDTTGPNWESCCLAEEAAPCQESGGACDEDTYDYGVVSPHRLLCVRDVDGGGTVRGWMHRHGGTVRRAHGRLATSAVPIGDGPSTNATLGFEVHAMKNSWS